MKRFILKILPFLVIYSQLSANFKVEVILFQHYMGNLSSQAWNTYPISPNLSQATSQLNNQDEANSSYERLPSDKLYLSNLAEAISNNQHYRLIAHTGWTQPSLVSQQSQKFHLYGNGDTDESVYDSSADWQYDGTIGFSAGAYVSAYVDMNFMITKDQVPSSLISKLKLIDFSQRDFIKLRQKVSQKITMEKLNYIDHPLFGIIIRVKDLRKLTSKDADEFDLIVSEV